MLELIKTSEKYLSSVLKVIDEYRNDSEPYGRGSINPLIKAIDENDVSKWLQDRQNDEMGINLKPGYVAGTSYWLMDDGEYVGSFTLRHSLTENLMKMGGNVAYIILPSKRRQGYAFKGLTLCLQEARKIGLNRVLITCNTKNVASFAVIMKAFRQYGGEILPDIAIDSETEHRVWINTINGDRL